MPETTPVTSPLDSAALELLHARYLGKDPEGRVVETPENMFRRVARHIRGRGATIWWRRLRMGEPV